MNKAAAPQWPDGRAYHIGLARGEVAAQILLVGDPARAERISARFSTVRVTRRCREYVTYTGQILGAEVSVMATGMGPDNTEIAIVELSSLVDNPVFLRVGTCGGLRPEIRVGEIVISTASVRLESVSGAYVEPGHPAIAHRDCVVVLEAAAKRLGHAHHVGLSATAAGFYGAQGRSFGTVPPRDAQLLQRLAAQGVLNMEMESSALFTLAGLMGARSGSVCAVIGNRVTDEFIKESAKHEAEERAIDTALHALQILRALDARGGLASVLP
ncbi:MAG: uridine phosphorylase [Planctomycetes bacterium]|nr:uridine phosphorylase [Planctomycetota bacterium]